MSAYVCLAVIDPDAGVVVDRRIGGNNVRAIVSQVLQRAPDHAEPGFASWGNVTAAEAAQISEAHYEDGITPDEVAQLAAELPDERYWWTVYMDW